MKYLELVCFVFVDCYVVLFEVIFCVVGVIYDVVWVVVVVEIKYVI